jgi:hypothetical protein
MRIFYLKEFIMALVATLSSSLITEDKNKKLSYYFGCIVFFYVIFCATHHCYSEEVEYNHNVIQTSEATFFIFPREHIDIDEFIAKGYSRNELITLMMNHKSAHDACLIKCENILRQSKLWTLSAKEVFDAAKVAVSTYAGGARNFLYPAVAAIVEYSFSKGYQQYQIWGDYQTALFEARYNAEMFDFYMDIIKKAYGG